MDFFDDNHEVLVYDREEYDAEAKDIDDKMAEKRKLAEKVEAGLIKSKPLATIGKDVKVCLFLSFLSFFFYFLLSFPFFSLPFILLFSLSFRVYFSFLPISYLFPTPLSLLTLRSSAQNAL